MRILHIIGSLGGGGAETQMKLLIRELADRGHEVGVVYLHEDLSFTRREGIEFMQISRGRKWDVYGLSKRLSAAINAFNPELVHCWLPEIMTIPAAIHCRVKKIPCLSAQRRILQDTARLGERMRDWLIPVSHLLSDRVVCNFEYDREPFLALKILKYRKAEVIRNGFEVARHGMAHQPPWFRDGAFKIIYVGRLVEQKKVDTLIRAVSQLREKGVDIQLGIYGTGECEKQLIELSSALSLKNGSDIVFAGYRTDWQQEAGAYDLFVLPSRAEGMPNVLVEAMGLGIATLASRIYEISSFVEHGRESWLVTPGESRELATEIERLYRDPRLMSQLASNGQKLAQSFSVPAMVDAYVSLYNSMI